MKRNAAIITLITFLTSTVLLANTLGLTDNGDGTWNVDYVSDGDIAGFQFTVDGAPVTSASGGAAGDAGFMVSSSSTIVLGFSLSGTTIPAGEGVLVVLGLEGTPIGLSGIIVSDPTGVDMGFTYDSGAVDGCTDMDACNYDADATVDDGNCDYGTMCWDGSYECDTSDCPDQPGSSVDINYNSDTPIAGFQFDVTGVTVTGVSGGAAGDAGFMISSGNNTVLGFSLTGVTIPPGEGVLIVLDVEGNAGDACIGGVILSDAAGAAIDQMVEDCTTIMEGTSDVEGCTDMDACNYNSDATVDDGSCDYAMENYDCDGNCTVDEDCADVCGGDAMEDNCGTCDNDPSNDCIEDCNGEWGGTAELDECGVCGGPGADVMCEDGSYVCDASDCDTGGDWDGNACSMDTNSIHVTSSGSVLYNTDTPIAGFQFNVDGATVLNAGGGEAEAQGFMISANETTVLGFSLTGATFGGCGTMIELELAGEATSLSGIIISDVDGIAIPFTYFDGSGGGAECGDGECNGDETEESCPEDCGTSGGTVSINYNSDTAIAGFQFTLDPSVTVTAAAGGAAEEAGFMMSTGNNTIVAFSLTGDYIPAGSGVLVELTIEGDAGDACLIDDTVILSDGNGVAIEQMVEDCVNITTGGGTDPYCGDGECNGDEDFVSCPEDCEEPGECTSDVCLSFANFDESFLKMLEMFDWRLFSGSFDIWMDNTVDVAGYQIELDGVTLTGASGGSSEEAGFMISNSETMVLGFSISGSVIPPSSGNLVTLAFSDYSGFVCFVDGLTTFSDADAQALSLTLGDCQGAGPVEGCTDMDACNYNVDANIDDGSCDYGTTCWDGNVECDASDCPDMPTVDVLYSTDSPIAGFQFVVTGATVVSASGGAAGDAGFNMAAGGGNNAVVGFSLTGDYIGVGQGVLTVLEIAGDPTAVCIENVLISDPYGYPIGYELDCLTISIGEPVGPECGDGFCDEGETAENCPEDCGGVVDCEEEEAWDGDACSMDVNSIHVTAGGTVLYNTDTPIAGFQFNLDGATINEASGGNSEAAGFMISTGGQMVLGFSLDGSTIDGCGTMIELELDGEATGLSGVIISDAGGVEISFTYFEGGGGNDGPCCGDENCDAGETEENCPEDCAGTEDPYCGDGECNGDEDSDSCPEDCGDDVVDCEETWDGNACSMPDYSLHLTSDGSVLYNSSTAIAGFQFEVDGATINGASGGDAEAAGFMLQAGDSMLLGFSLDGSSISGCGIMVTLDLDGDATGLSGIIMADIDGVALPFTYFGGGDGNDGPCCGDENCDAGETEENCPEDCAGTEDPYCGDGECNGDEDSDSCPEDCGSVDCGDPFCYNQSQDFSYYFVFSAYNCEGNYLTANEDWIGVYNGDVCVGGASWLGGPTDIEVMGDDGQDYSDGYLTAGDMPTYKIYDASEDKYYDALPNENFGFEVFTTPNIIRMDAVFAQYLSLDEGANLVSFYVLPEDTSVEDMMEPLGGNITAVLSEGGAAQYLDDWGWIGSLTHFEFNAGYWLIMSAADELLLESCEEPITDIVYNLDTGPNLISYPSPGSTLVSEAIPDDVEDLFEAILSEGGAAMNLGGGYWVGSLTSFSGGIGYWVIVEDDLSFSYNIDSGGLGRIEEYVETLPQGPEFKILQSSQQAFYFVDQVELLDGAIENGDWLLSYNGNMLTGIRQWQGVVIDVPAMGTAYDHAGNVFEGTAGYFQIGDTPTFKLLKNTTGELIQLGGDVDEWTSNGVFTISGLTEVPVPEEFGLDSAYPNPFNPVTTLKLNLPMDSQVSIQVYNVQGRLVETLADHTFQAGYHLITWNADQHSSGMYFVKMIAGDQVSTQKLLLVK